MRPGAPTTLFAKLIRSLNITTLDVKRVLVMHLNDWTEVETVWIVNGCRTTQEWHVHYVAAHNVSDCQSLLIRKTCLGLHFCSVIIAQSWIKFLFGCL